MNKKKLSVDEVIDFLQITSPFLMVDYVEQVIPGESCHAVKKIKQDDWFFNCHLEQEGLMPGTLIIEAMLQTLVLTLYTMESHKGKLSFVTDISSKLLSKVSYDSQLDIHAKLLSYKRGATKGQVDVKVNNLIVCNGEFTLISPHNMLVPDVS